MAGVKGKELTQLHAAELMGLATVRRRKQAHRQRRERKPRFGAMVQLDGSHQDWFEGRRANCVLRVRRSCGSCVSH